MRSSPHLLPALSAAILSSAGATKPLHALTVVSGDQLPIAIHNSLVSAYASFGDLCTARQMFDRMPHRTPASFNSLIAAYAQHGHSTDALALLMRMMAEGTRPTQFTFGPILSSPSLDLSAGIQLHPLILKTGLLHKDPFSGTALVGFLGRIGRVDDALEVFDEMPERNVVTWNSVISGFSQHGFAEDSIFWFMELLRSPFRPSEYSFVSILSAFWMSECSELVEQLHGFLRRNGMVLYLEVTNALLNAYVKCVNVYAAEVLMNELSNRDLVTWNTMIAAFTKNGLPDSALKLFLAMPMAGLYPNDSTFSSVISACSDLNVPEYGELVHAKAIKSNLANSVYVSSSLVCFYAKCTSPDDAYMIFNEIPVKNVACWNALISGCCDEDSGALLGILQEMLHSGFLPNEFTISLALRRASSLDLQQLHSLSTKLGYDSNVFVFSALISSYDAHGIIFETLAFDETQFPDFSTTYMNTIAGIYNRECRFQETKQLLSKLRNPDTISWNILLTACARNGDYLEAFKLFKHMLSAGFLMDNYTAVSVLSICSRINCLKLGGSFHGLVLKTNSGCSEVFVNNVLLDMYAKCGSLESSLNVFEEMAERNLITWTALISGLGLHGCIQEALERFEQMEVEGFKPDHVVFIAVLSGCRHSGLVEEGMRLFRCMKNAYGIEPDMNHYTCIVDLLCRYGHLKEAELIINNMPFQPNAVIWRAFLQGCKRYGNRITY